jgi:hypothetical protein
MEKLKSWEVGQATAGSGKQSLSDRVRVFLNAIIKTGKHPVTGEACTLERGDIIAVTLQRVKREKNKDGVYMPVKDAQGKPVMIGDLPIQSTGKGNYMGYKEEISFSRLALDFQENPTLEGDLSVAEIGALPSMTAGSKTSGFQIRIA